ncbi:MAG TPA: hypothetical protein VG295_09310 [Solirubrobacteraceae bacterium]|nr:hypothetical protein [Solirubrobacteraceae bacterium]
MTTVIVSGAIANKHLHSGSAWVRMSWAEGLRRLGFEVLFVERLSASWGGCAAELARSANAKAFDAAMRAFDFGDRSALLSAEGASVCGMAREELLDRCAGAALLVNISGHLRDPCLLGLARRRAFIDLDPVYTQVWHAQGHDVGIAGHDLHFTVGTNVGTQRCELPAGGVRWRPIRQPVVLERWPVGGDRFTRFTTIGSWRGAYGPISWNNRTYGVKAHEFRRLADVPRRSGLPFEVVLDLHPADEGDAVRLRAGGWTTLAPSVVGDTSAFARYVRDSGAELSAAQGAYVHTRSGWCSDRTVRYLASGRPALVQDTGQADTLPVGVGLVTFATPDQAVVRARAIVADYETHRLAARRIAEEWFAPEHALAPLLHAAEIAP